jgi:hypothetical protein
MRFSSSIEQADPGIFGFLGRALAMSGVAIATSTPTIIANATALRIAVMIEFPPAKKACRLSVDATH